MHKGRHTNMHTDTFNRRWSYKTYTEGGLSFDASQNFNANTNDALDNEIS